MTFPETAIALIILRCDRYLESTGVRRSLKKYPSLSSFVSLLTDGDMKSWAQALASEDKDEPDIRVVRYRRVLHLLGDLDVMQSFLELSLALFSFPEFGAYLTEYFGYSVNLHLAFLLEGVPFPGVEEIERCIFHAGKICYVDPAASPMQYAELRIDERVFGYLFGSDEMNPLLTEFTFCFDPGRDGDKLHEAFVHEELISAGTAFLGNEGDRPGEGRILQLSGKGGRRFLVKHIAKNLSMRVLFVNISDFFRKAGRDGLESLKAALIREAVFDDAAVCFYGITEYFMTGGVEESEKSRLDQEALGRIFFTPITDAGISLILCSDMRRAILDPQLPNECLLLELPEETDYEDRRRLWEGFAKLGGLTLEADRFAMRYRLSPSEISLMIRGFAERMPQTTDIGAGEEALFARLCIERAEAGESRSVGRVLYPSLHLDDVKVKPQIRAVLNDAIEGIRKSPVILDSWKLRQNYPYGRSVSLLLSGPPGTGKTMTANAIAGELSLPLYQVNLSSIVDKYIGETEKNLEKGFLFAEKTDSVLFFDEADALFGVRSEVHDSKDRYANTEISYLLQRIEAYDGIVIMATNIMSNIDPAFLRRIRYVVRFENPDESLRREIWESCIPEGLPHEDLDMDYLSSQFDTFTGSMIKTVFLNACAYAAGRDEILSMAHLIHAVRLELGKASSVSFTADLLGKYAYLL